MAFKGKRDSKFRTARKARGKARRGKSTGALTTALKALKIAKGIQKGIEYKYVDYPLLADDIYSNGLSYSLLAGLAKGDTALTRTGDTIKLARAHINLTCHIPVGSVATNTRTFRVMLVRGIRENQVKPEMAITASASKGVLDDSVVPLILCRKAVNNMRDTKILFDKIYTLTPGQRTKYEFRWNFKLDWVCRFGSDSANLPEDGGLYLMLCEDYNNGDILCNMNHRITYSDL